MSRLNFAFPPKRTIVALQEYEKRQIFSEVDRLRRRQSLQKTLAKFAQFAFGFGSTSIVAQSSAAFALPHLARAMHGLGV
jgi:hypothetical protein